MEFCRLDLHFELPCNWLSIDLKRQSDPDGKQAKAACNRLSVDLKRQWIRCFFRSEGVGKRERTVLFRQVLKHLLDKKKPSVFSDETDGF